MLHTDYQYNKLVKRILTEGVSNVGKEIRPRWKDGTPAYTKSVFFHTMSFEPNELPLLTTKYVAWKTAIKEMLWIWQLKSNNVDELVEMGVKIWNEWKLEDCTIGAAYGYQLSRKVIEVKGQFMDQVDYVINELTKNPKSRRILTELWNIYDLSKMSLTPCVHHTQWDTFDDRLNLLVKARSSDVGLGLAFNLFQYAVLHRMISQVTGIELGMFHFVIGNAHIYDRHEDVLREQIESPSLTLPKLLINPDINNFYDFTIDDFFLMEYEREYLPLRKMEIAE